MKLKDIVERLPLRVCSGKGKLETEVLGGYVSDLLSDVMAHARKGDLWITLQIHQNTIAVAILKELAGIILVNGKEPPPETAHKADDEGVPVLSTPLTAYEMVCGLHDLGIAGKR